MLTAMPVDFGEYDVEGELGRGTFGCVYEGRHRRFRDRKVAIKQIRLMTAVTRERALREAEALGRLEHPNIVAVHDAGTVNDTFCIVMELVGGGTLEQELDVGAPLERLLDHLADAARGVAVAHERGVVHRDLKPSNVLVGPRGAKVCDFGIALHVDRETVLTKTGEMLGTLSYAAPEQAKGADVGPAADVYSLGAILYHVLAGRPPHAAPTAMELLVQVLEGPIEPPSRVASRSVPRALEQLCLRALRREPEARPPDAGAFLAELQAARAEPASQQRRLRAAGGVALLVTGLALCASWLGSRSSRPSSLEAPGALAPTEGAVASGATHVAARRPVASVSSRAVAVARQGVLAFAEKLTMMDVFDGVKDHDGVTLAAHAAGAALASVKDLDAGPLGDVLAPLAAPARRFAVSAALSVQQARDTTDLLEACLGELEPERIPPKVAISRAILLHKARRSETHDSALVLESLARVHDDPLLAGLALCGAADIESGLDGTVAARVDSARHVLALDDEATKVFAEVARPEDRDELVGWGRHRHETRRDACRALYQLGPDDERDHHRDEAIRLALEATEDLGTGTVGAVRQAFIVLLEMIPRDPRVKTFHQRFASDLASGSLEPEYVRVFEGNPLRALELARARNPTASPPDRNDLLGIEVSALLDLGRISEARAVLGGSDPFPAGIPRLGSEALNARLREAERR
jgi:hypothetical protein